MKNFLKNNWLKICIFLLITAFVIIVYKVSIINNAKYQKLSEQCEIDGKKYPEEDVVAAEKEESNDGVDNCYVKYPLYLFSENLNTCLYYGGYHCDLNKIYKGNDYKGEHYTRWSEHVIDVDKNKILYKVYMDEESPDELELYEKNKKLWSEAIDFRNKVEELGF